MAADLASGIWVVTSITQSLSETNIMAKFFVLVRAARISVWPWKSEAGFMDGFFIDRRSGNGVDLFVLGQLDRFFQILHGGFAGRFGDLADLDLGRIGLVQVEHVDDSAA